MRLRTPRPHVLNSFHAGQNTGTPADEILCWSHVAVCGVQNVFGTKAQSFVHHTALVVYAPVDWKYCPSVVRMMKGFSSCSMVLFRQLSTRSKESNTFSFISVLVFLFAELSRDINVWKFCSSRPCLIKMMGALGTSTMFDKTGGSFKHNDHVC